jgi:hypothetical protein
MLLLLLPYPAASFCSSMARVTSMTRTTAVLSGFALICIGILSGCHTTDPTVEPGPDGTVACYLKVESSRPGVTIETNSVFAGKTPLTVKVFGDVNGTFHNFGSPEFVLRAVPPMTNEFTQIHSFRAGKRSEPGDKIPGLVFFDMSKPSGGLIIDAIPDR